MCADTAIKIIEEWARYVKLDSRVGTGMNDLT